MRFPLYGLLRLTTIVGVMLSIVAVGVSRAVPRPQTFHDHSSPRYYAVNGVVLNSNDPANYLLDTETGRLNRVDGDIRGSLQYTSFAPWNNTDGEGLAVGRLTRFTGSNLSIQCDRVSLGVFRWPEKRLVAEIDMPSALTGRPCWLPGFAARAILSTADGRLHVVDFPTDDAAAEDGQALEYPEPVPLTWRCDPPGEGVPFLSDSFCPYIPAIGGKLVVAMNRLTRVNGSIYFAATELWWLQLGPNSREIVAAGRLFDPSVDSAGHAVSEDRLPNLVATRDGRLMVAYISRPLHDQPWGLYVAPVSIDHESGALRAERSASRELMYVAASTLPAFSADGRWLFGINPREPAKRAVVRFPVNDLVKPVKTSLAAAE